MKRRCKKSVMRGFHAGTCLRLAKKDGYCHQHHPDTIAEKGRVDQAAFEKKMANSPIRQLARAQQKIELLKAKNKRLTSFRDKVCAGNPELQMIWQLELYENVCVKKAENQKN